MGLFDKLRGRQEPAVAAAPTVYDPFLGDDWMRNAHAALLAGSWAETSQLLNDRPDHWLIAEIFTSDHAAVPRQRFEEWAAAEPTGMSLALLGRAHTRDAWAIRGGRRAEFVESGAWSGFFEGLEYAESVLDRAVSLDPDSVEPWVAKLTTGRGLQVSKDDLRHRFEEVQKRELFRPDACAQMLQGLCDKWGGSHDEMFAFARWIEREAPPHAAARAQLPMAYLERSLDQDDASGRHGDAYLAAPENNAAIVKAAMGYLAATPEDTPPSHLGPLNCYVNVLVPFNRPSSDVIRTCVQRIAGRPTLGPWFMWGDDIIGTYTNIARARLAAAEKF